MNLFAPLPPETARMMDGIPALIDKTFPLPSRFRSALPEDVAELSRLLTSGRGERGLSYLGQPALLSAYLRFFLPWKLYRLCRLLPGLDLPLAANNRITDLGCGPLTFASALWISRPDLRTVPLEFHCIDRSGPALDAGRKFFAALTASGEAGEDSHWKMHTSKSDFSAARPSAQRQTSDLVCAVNVFNEMYGDISRTDNVRRSAEKSARLLANHAYAGACILVVEPGFPRCGEFISLLRSVLLEHGRLPLSPCPHGKECPIPGGGRGSTKRWCHFAFETEDAPAALQKLSAAARLPKERAVLSFLFAGPGPAKATLTPAATTPQLRVISDAFPLPPNQSGRYCCCGQGLALLSGEKNAIEKIAPGALANAIVKKDKKDAKSGALIAEFE
jgi:hypothetical protein